VYQRYIELNETLIRKVDHHLNSIVKCKGDESQLGGLINERVQRMRSLVAEIHRLFKTAEKAFQQVEALNAT
jgi:hypothetical protein